MEINNEVDYRLAQRIDDIIEYAAQNVPYYINNFNKKYTYEDNFEVIPFLSKNQVLNNNETNEFISKDYTKSELVHDRTSGSTGKILDIYWNQKDYIRSLMSLWSKRKICYNILPNSKACYFHSIAYRTYNAESMISSPHILIKDKGNTLSLSKLDFSDRMLNIYYNTITKYQPEWVMCHPSTLYLFAMYMKENHLEPIQSIRYVELTGEQLSQKHREKIEEILHAPTRNEYGAKEFNGIAYECKCGKLHCLSSNVLVEVIKDGRKARYGEKGEICVTTLNNYAMPLIRYMLGDIGTLYDGRECKCGDCNPIIVIDAGRSNDVILREDGSYIECVVLYYMIEFINNRCDNIISQFQVIQKSLSLCEVRLVLCNVDDIEMKSYVETLFRMKAKEYRLENIEWIFIYSDRIIPNLKTEKMNYYVKEMTE